MLALMRSEGGAEKRQLFVCRLALATVQQNNSGQIRQSERVVELTIREEPGVGVDAAAVEFQFQAPVENRPAGSHHPIHPQGVPMQDFPEPNQRRVAALSASARSACRK